jgi:hypothetical protein
VTVWFSNVVPFSTRRRCTLGIVSMSEAVMSSVRIRTTLGRLSGGGSCAETRDACPAVANAKTASTHSKNPPCLIPEILA